MVWVRRSMPENATERRCVACRLSTTAVGVRLTFKSFPATALCAVVMLSQPRPPMNSVAPCMPASGPTSNPSLPVPPYTFSLDAGRVKDGTENMVSR